MDLEKVNFDKNNRGRTPDTHFKVRTLPYLGKAIRELKLKSDGEITIRPRSWGGAKMIELLKYIALPAKL